MKNQTLNEEKVENKPDMPKKTLWQKIVDFLDVESEDDYDDHDYGFYDNVEEEWD